MLTLMEGSKKISHKNFEKVFKMSNWKDLIRKEEDYSDEEEAERRIEAPWLYEDSDEQENRAKMMDIYRNLNLELKIGYNKASEKQKDWINQLNKRGYLAKVTNGWDNTIKEIDKYLEL